MLLSFNCFILYPAQVPLGANGCAYFTFEELCDRPLGAADYFGLCSKSFLGVLRSDSSQGTDKLKTTFYGMSKLFKMKGTYTCYNVNCYLLSFVY